MLQSLGVPRESQGLVFSKTSFQARRISPRSPRAIYFNDDLYIGWVQDGEVLEIAAVDPKQGPVFYLLRQRQTDRPRFVRENSSCMQCHQSQSTGDLPGLLMRSVYPDMSGMPVLPAGTYVSTDQSPLKERWGGWYFDGNLHGQESMGDSIVVNPDRPQDMTDGGTELRKKFDLAPYLTPHSDVVALMVLTHQTHLHNLMTRAAHDTCLALRDEAVISRVLNERTTSHSSTTLDRIKSACEPLVQAILFSGEATLSAPIDGSTGFAKQFESFGPFDQKGRSLRQFDLHTRLFRYPCSYLIYSEQFNWLPDPAKQYVYRRLWKVLTGRDDSREFSHLSDGDRDSIYQVLLETKRDLPAYWQPAH